VYRELLSGCAFHSIPSIPHSTTRHATTTTTTTTTMRVWSLISGMLLLCTIVLLGGGIALGKPAIQPPNIVLVYVVLIGSNDDLWQ
jgi:hypothetical protein